MSDDVIREENAPEEIGHPRTLTKRQWYAEKELENINRRLDEGNRSFANQRNTNEALNKRIADVELEFTRKLGELQLDFNKKISDVQNALDGKISQEATKVTSSFKVLEDTVNPRAPWWRVAAWVAAFAIPAGIAIGGWIWVASRYPDRQEFRGLDERVQKVEVFKAVIERGGKP